MINHIAMILDGNRRWAKKNNLPTLAGHLKGRDNFEKICKYADKIGVKYLTAYIFSTENWKRNIEEVNYLMDMLDKYTINWLNKEGNFKMIVLGNKDKLSSKIAANLTKLEEKTKNNTGLTVCLCINYGGRSEIVDAFKNIYDKISSKEEITEELITNNLYTKGIPDPDLVIRTAGEYRLSNFLPWQTTYSELYFVCDKYFPEFTSKDLDLAIEEYNRRTRRFGGN